MNEEVHTRHETRAVDSAPTVFLAEDNEAVVGRVRELLRGKFRILGAVEDGAGLVDSKLAREADVIVTDISMPGIDGVEAVRRLRADGCTAAVVFFSVHRAEVVVRAALDCGAAGYVVKSRAAQDLIPAIRAVAGGGRFLSPTLNALSA